MILQVRGQNAHAATGGIDGGPSEKPTVVLIHGAGMNATVWSLQTRYLAYRGFRALAVDLPGHGQSEGEPLTTIEDMATWIVEFLAAAGVERAHLIGHSMGTFIALEVAATRPELVESLSLLGTAPAMPVHPQLLDHAANDLPAAAALMAAWGHAKPAHVGDNPTPGLWMVGGARALVEQSRPGALTADFGACLAYEHAADRAAAVVARTLVLAGSGDKMTPPKQGRILADQLTQVEFVQLESTGHQMMTENPRVVNRALLANLHR